MPLSEATITSTVSWKLTKTNTGFAATKQGTDSKSFTLSFDTDTVNQLFAAEYTIAAAGTQTIDLQSFTNLVSEAVVLTKAYAVYVLPTGSSVKIEPGASNPLTWFFSGTSPAITIPASGLFVYSQPTAQTVNGTTKTLKLTNPGGTSLTVDVVIIGGT